jgi:cytochrome c oxidase subunit 3
MSTVEATHDAHDQHLDDHGDHDHPPFLAHHFDTPEQQYDSGKLGIWLFLIQEVLFFSGMFCAYAIFRSLNPEVFEGCSQFLNTQLGAINTTVLLFSSLTMALAVRCSQIEDHKGLTRSLTATLCCAMVFLGVKAVEYSHKWAMGLLPPVFYFYNPENPHPTLEEMKVALGPNADWANFFYNGLYYLCLPLVVLTVGVVIWLVSSIIRNNKFQADVAKPTLLVCLSFFAGVYLGSVLVGLESAGHAGDDHGAAHAVADHGHDATGHSHDASFAGQPTDHSPTAAAAAGVHQNPDKSILERLASDETNSGVQSKLNALQRQTAVAGSAIVHDRNSVAPSISQLDPAVHTPRRAGVFFGIYYCMTGIHAIHILGGIVVLMWLLVRSIRHDFNRHYFGPVDSVGLYWHLVDLVWIYLFPLLYLIR